MAILCANLKLRKDTGMKDYSTMTTVEFLLSVAWKTLIWFIWYKNLLFRVLPQRDVYESLFSLGIMMLVSVAFFISGMNHWKNEWTAIACCGLPFGIYTAITYFTTSTLFIIVVVVASFIISVIYSGILLTRKNKHRSRVIQKRVFKNRISRCEYAMTCIIAYAMIFLMVGIGWNSFWGTGIMPSSIEAEGIVEDIKNEDTMEANMDEVLKLFPTTWETLNTHERINVLQTVCNIEAHYLGLDYPITVQGDNLSQYNLGSYSDTQRLIRINLDHIENDTVEEVLSSLLHEVHHSYEYRLADVYNSILTDYRDLRLFKDAIHYSKEVDDYINPREDYYGYMSQHLELDSETYAELGVKEYYTRIEKWIQKNGCENAN